MEVLVDHNSKRSSSKPHPEGAAAFANGIIDSITEHPDMEQAKKLAGDLADQSAEFIRKYPLQSVCGAAAIGFMLGAFLAKRK